MLGWSISALAGVVPLVLAIALWRRLTLAGLVAGSVTAAGTWVALWHRSGYGEVREYGFPEPGSLLASVFPFLPPLHPAVAIGFCTAAATVAFSLLTDPPREPMLRIILRRLKPLAEADKPTVTGSGTEEE